MAELNALLTHAAHTPLPHTGWLRVTGSDRVRWLNGMVTNSIQALAPGEGCYNFLLNAQGRIQGDATAFLLDDAILLETTQPGPVASLLDHYIIMDDVELAHITEGRSGLLLAGPSAQRVLQNLGLPAPEPIHLAQTAFAGQSLEVIGAYSPLVPRFELWASPQTVDALIQAVASAGVTAASPEAFEQLRMLEGIPCYGTDIRDRDLPQETNQARALHFNKGCYLGQEIVERIRSRGQVHRTFSGFLLKGDLPAVNTPLTADTAPGARPVGELTSVGAIDHPTAGHLQLALGYIRREFLPSAPGVAAPNLYYAGGTANAVSTPFTAADR